MDDNFLSMPDDQLPEFAAAEQQAMERASAAATTAEVETPAATVEAAETQQEVSPAAEQAALENAAATAKDDDDDAGDAGVVVEEEHNALNDPDDAVQVPVVKAEADKAKAKEDPAPETEPEKDKTKVDEPTAATVETDPASFQTKILAPFKANGREMQVKDADEAIRLMQMGANYNLKMASLKPQLGMMRQLDEAGLLNPEAVANVIDLLKHKNPAAIAQLAKNAGVDPLDVSEEDVKGYVPKPEVVNETRIALEETLDEIQYLPSYQRVIQATKGFDAASKGLISQHPHVLKFFEQHMTQGIYDVIDAEVNRRKALGSLPASTPYLHAYKQVGDELDQQGAFASLVQAKATEPAVKAPAVVVKNVTAAPVAKDPAVSQRRKAAATTASVPSTKSTDPMINALAMSDEDFEQNAKLHMNFPR